MNNGSNMPEIKPEEIILENTTIPEGLPPKKPKIIQQQVDTQGTPIKQDVFWIPGPPGGPNQ